MISNRPDESLKLRLEDSARRVLVAHGISIQEPDGAIILDDRTMGLQLVASIIVDTVGLSEYEVPQILQAYVNRPHPRTLAQLATVLYYCIIDWYDSRPPRYDFVSNE